MSYLRGVRPDVCTDDVVSVHVRLCLCVNRVHISDVALNGGHLGHSKTGLGSTSQRSGSLT